MKFCAISAMADVTTIGWNGIQLPVDGLNGGHIGSICIKVPNPPQTSGYKFIHKW